MAHADNFLRFRARLQTAAPEDVHRDFQGTFFPDTRTVEVNEIRHFGRTVRLLPIFIEDAYTKEDGPETTYVVEDFVVGNRLSLGQSVSQRDKGAIKTFVLTEVDSSHLKRVNFPTMGMTQKRRKASPAGSVGQSAFSKVATTMTTENLIRTIGSYFQVVDHAGERKLHKSHLLEVLQNHIPGLTEVERTTIISSLPTDERGYIAYEDFLDGTGLNISDKRRDCVLKAFRKIDYNKNGVISPDEFVVFYNAAYHPKVTMGLTQEHEVTQKFLDNFDFDHNGKVTFWEFEDYYIAESAKTPDDEEFFHMMNRAWNLDRRNVVGIPFH